jgi:hypothetical protein
LRHHKERVVADTGDWRLCDSLNLRPRVIEPLRRGKATYRAEDDQADSFANGTGLATLIPRASSPVDRWIVWCKVHLITGMLPSAG